MDGYVDAVGLGVGVAVGLGLGVADGVGLDLGVGDAVGLADDVGEEDGFGVADDRGVADGCVLWRGFAMFAGGGIDKVEDPPPPPPQADRHKTEQIAVSKSDPGNQFLYITYPTIDK